MDRAKKRLASAIDGIKAQFTDADSQDDACSEPSTAEKCHYVVKEKIEAAHCRMARIVRHGFPSDPKCMAFDPVQKLCAIGAGRGCIRLLGQAGVDHLLKHDSDEPVLHLQFLVNEGGLVTALRDDTLHLWNYRQRIPEVVNSLRFKERITAVYLPFQSKWLLIGTDKGNIYFVSLSTFELSPQVVYWNKAVDMTCRTHPGSIQTMESCPTEPSKVLIVFDRGHVVLWNVLTKEAEKFTAAAELSPVTAISWHPDGRQFMCGHQNGSLSIWNVKKPKEVVHKSTPHSATPEDSASTACRPITQLSWNINADGDQLIVFAGGQPKDEGALPSLTVLRAKGSLTVLEMDHAIIKMVPLNSSPYASVPQHPPAIAVLLKNDLLVVDMQAQGYPCFEVPHPMDLHESPVTILRYFSDCPVELIAALTLVGRNQRRQGVRLSDKQWPINGGIGRECATGHQEMLLTGHEDGSIKFWQASSEQLQIIYKLKTGRHFEKCLAHFSTFAHTNSNNEKPIIAPLSHAVAGIEMCLSSRLLLVSSCSGQVSLFRFAKTECCQEIAVIPLPHLCRSTISFSTPSCPPSPSYKDKEDDQQQSQQTQVPSSQTHHQNRLKQQSRSSGSSGSAHYGQKELKRQGPVTEAQPSRNSSHSTDTTSMGSNLADFLPLKVRGGALRRPAGYQPELVCQIPWINGLKPERVTAMALSSAYGLVAVGTTIGLALVDVQTATLIYAWSNSELLGREPIPFWTSQETVTSPTVDGLSPPPILLSAPPFTPPQTQKPNSARSLRARLKHQFSTQSPPVQPSKSPGPLSRGNTTDSAQQQLDSRFSGLGARLQRPQLTKAFTCNPTSSNLGEEGQPSATDIALDCSGLALGTESANGGQNCNGDMGVDSSQALLSDSLEKAAGHSQKCKNANDDFVCSLQFINCCAKKGVSKCEPCLWLGTSSGSSVAFQLQLPANRITSSVFVAPSEMFNGRKGSLIRLSGRILCMTFLDQRFCLLAGPAENFKSGQEQNKECQSVPLSAGDEKTGGASGERESQKPNKVLTKSQSPVLCADSSENPTSTGEEEFLQIGIFVSESEIRGIALPTYRQPFHRHFGGQTAEEVPLVRAAPTHIGGQPALAALNAAGAIIVLSLPSFRTLLHCPMFPHSVDIDDRLCDRFQLSEHGLGMYMVSPSEVQKFTISAEIAAQVADCMAELFVPCDLPEPPRQQSFLRGVMSTLAAAAGAASNGCASEQLAEMDTLLSEKPASSIASSQVRNVARAMITPQQQLGGIEFGTSRTVTAGQAAREAMQNLSERNERLGAAIDATEQLRNNAQNIQSRSAKLLEKYEKKKWYQL